MKTQYTLGLLALCAALAAPGAASAQSRGRTDGPENSEFGKGGYEKADNGRFSLSLDWGAAISQNAALSGTRGAPLFAGLTGGYWVDDWLILELSPQYVFQTHSVNVLAGPKLRTPGYPVGLTGGVKAGAVIGDGSVAFAVSPHVGADVVFSQNILAGLNYALDVPLGVPGITHRVFMNIGYRF